MRLQFAKMTGAGNDFVLIDDRADRLTQIPRIARRLCDRRFGVGADGLLVIKRSRIADYRMLYYNADGTSGGMCGNGGRCIARYAILKRIAAARHTFEALRHVYRARARGRQITLHMKDATLDTLGCRLRLASGVLRYDRINTGAPHATIALPQTSAGTRLESVDMLTLGRRLRYHRAFSPEGTNVNLYEPAGRDTIRMRTYERGVEDETLACGTGSIASAISAALELHMNPPITVITQSRRRLRVNFRLDEGIATAVTLTGPAELVFEGTVHA